MPMEAAYYTLYYSAHSYTYLVFHDDNAYKALRGFFFFLETDPLEHNNSPAL